MWRSYYVVIHPIVFLSYFTFVKLGIVTVLLWWQVSDTVGTSDL